LRSTISRSPPLKHSKPTLGYCLQGPTRRIAYLTDTCGLPLETERFLCRWQPDALLLDCTFAPGEGAHNHNDLELALEIVDSLGASEAWLTHISHRLDSAMLAGELELPHGVGLAHDGQVIAL
jgi:phosphoribosyl 1,2-cyclic phosphate phosphodiesterase